MIVEVTKSGASPAGWRPAGSVGAPQPGVHRVGCGRSPGCCPTPAGAQEQRCGQFAHGAVRERGRRQPSMRQHSVWPGRASLDKVSLEAEEDIARSSCGVVGPYDHQHLEATYYRASTVTNAMVQSS